MAMPSERRQAAISIMTSLNNSLVRTVAGFAATVHLAMSLVAQQASPVVPPIDLKVMAWNIWHGGREDGKDVGPARVIDVIRNSGADVVAMQETYGSGELIQKELG